MLKDDWHETWPASIRQQFRSGRYVLADVMDKDARVAVWEEAG
jgi:hypothetical protein